jgi:hypothetical protein
VVVIAAIVGWLVMRLGGNEEVDVADIERELTELSEALRLDQMIELHVLPSAVPDATVPTTLHYRRLVPFWQPAFAAARERG